MTRLNELVRKAHENAVEKGFHEGDRPFAVGLALIHAEVSEALEAHREGERYKLDLTPAQWDQLMNAPTREGIKTKLASLVKHQKPDHYKEELADVAIRLADLCGQYAIDLDKAVRDKMRHNETRAYRHGKEY